LIKSGREEYCADNLKKILRLLRLQHRRLYLRQLRLAMLGGSPSRTRANYWQRSGARHQLAPECRKLPSRPATSSISATRQSQQCSGARQQLRLRSWLRFYDNNMSRRLRSVASTSTVPTMPHSIKAKFPFPRVDYYLLLPHPTLGGYAMKNYLAYH
jgi:hypothetical protein